MALMSTRPLAGMTQLQISVHRNVLLRHIRGATQVPQKPGDSDNSPAVVRLVVSSEA